VLQGRSRANAAPQQLIGVAAGAGWFFEYVEAGRPDRGQWSYLCPTVLFARDEERVTGGGSRRPCVVI